MFTFLERFADLVVVRWLGLDVATHLGGSLHFFIYDTLKIFLLLTTIIFFVAIIRSWFPPERTKQILSHEREYVGNVMRRCSASSPFLFLLGGAAVHRLRRVRVPLGVTFSFLIASPMVNEIALILLWGCSAGRSP